MSIVIFGSINMDMIASTVTLPQPGETVIGHHFRALPGGKGANQAVAAAKLDTSTYLIGRVGNDSFGQELLQGLQGFKINTQGIYIDHTTSSGIAMINVETTGENTIVVVPGANHKIDESDVNRLRTILPKTSLLLLQLEIPLEAVELAVKEAKKFGVTVILDPAPAVDHFPDQLYTYVDIITPNQTEAAKLVGFHLTDNDKINQAADNLLNKGVKITVIKLGKTGAFYATEHERGFVQPFLVQSVDNVGAGDGFNGGLAAALDRGLCLKEALKWGSMVGALTTTKEGAQTAMPDLKTIESCLKINE